jgi:hypothetical protein
LQNLLKQATQVVATRGTHGGAAQQIWLARLLWPWLARVEATLRTMERNEVFPSGITVVWRTRRQGAV